MKNNYEYFDSVSEFGSQASSKFDGLMFYYCYVNCPSLDRVYRVEIKAVDTSCALPWFEASIYYRGSRSRVNSVHRFSVRACVERVYELLKL